MSQLIDFTDLQLFELFQESGVLLADEDRRYSRNDLMRMARKAYWYGVEDKATDPEILADVAERFVENAAADRPA